MWRVSWPRVEWPTVGMLVLCYGAWLLATWLSGGDHGWLWLPIVALSITLHSSLQHEATHGHPTRLEAANTALVFPALGLFMPYGRFRALHRAHHSTAALTDPVQDTESFYLAPETWARASRPLRSLLETQNTLVGRVTLGPAIALARFYCGDLRALYAGSRDVKVAWLIHIPAVACVLTWTLGVCGVGLLEYVLAAYAGYGVLMLRTFAEHRAYPDQGGRSVVIEDRGPLAWLFLNNNLHAVHHRHPRAPWYVLPRLYADTRSQTLARNADYRFDGYGDLFRLYAFRTKEPVVHPLGRAPHG